MVQIRPVRVAVDETLVAMPVAVSRGRGEVSVLVEVMSIVVLMRMDVLEHLVPVIVLVLAQKEQSHRSRQERRSRDVLPAERFAQEPKRECSPDEGSAGEESLSPRSAQLVRGGYVERNAHAVREPSDEQGPPYLHRGRLEGTDREPDPQVRRPGDQALPERASRGAHAIDKRGPVVVESPADTRERHQSSGRHTRPAASPGDERAGQDRTHRTDPARATQMLTEEEHAENGGRDHLEVEEERDGTREGRLQSEEEHSSVTIFWPHCRAGCSG